MEDSVTEDGPVGADLTTLLKWFDDAEEMSEQGRKESERARDYYDGRQWTRDELDTLNKRKQPAVTDNRIKRKVDYLRGLEVSSRVDPKAYPRTPNEQKSAEAATDALRYAMDRARFQQKRAAVWENLCIEGAGGVSVEVEPSKAGYDIVVKHVAWDRLFWDPHSRAPDFSDARYTGVVVWMDAAEARARWPDKLDVIEEATSKTASFSRTFDDRPERGSWSDPDRKRIRFAEIYYQHDGDGWCRAVYTQAGFLEDSAPSPYLDENGEPTNAMVLASCYVDRDNDRYGVVRDMISPQDEVNKRKQKALHLLNVRQVVADQGAVADVDKARQEMAKPDGYLEVTPNLRFDIQQTADLATGQVTLLQEAKASLDLMGPNAAMQGKQGQSASGRAIALSQQGGQIEVSALTDAVRDWHWRVMRQVWNRIRQFWTGETWVRVTDDPRNMRWVALNRPVTMAEEMGLDPQMAAGDPQLAQVARVENSVAELDVDLILEEAPDTVTIQAEEFQTLAELAKAGFPIPPDVLIEASSLRSKDVILERMRAQAQQPPPPDPQMLEIERKARKDQTDSAQAQEELQFKRESKAVDVATARDDKAADIAMTAAQMFARQAMPPVAPAA